MIDQAFLRNICPQGFDSFTFKPHVGASRGILVAWKGKGLCFLVLKFCRIYFAMSVGMTSTFNNNSWILTTIFAPFTPAGKRNFLDLFKHPNA